MSTKRIRIDSKSPSNKNFALSTSRSSRVFGNVYYAVMKYIAAVDVDNGVLNLLVLGSTLAIVAIDDWFSWFFLGGREWRPIRGVMSL